jgi:hypothetical protein
MMTDPDAKICGPDLSDSCINSDGGDCGYDNIDDGNEDWALWDENNQVFSMIPFHASAGYKPPRSRRMPVSSDKF